MNSKCMLVTRPVSVYRVLPCATVWLTGSGYADWSYRMGAWLPILGSCVPLIRQGLRQAFLAAILSAAKRHYKGFHIGL